MRGLYRAFIEGVKIGDIATAHSIREKDRDEEGRKQKEGNREKEREMRFGRDELHP